MSEWIQIQKSVMSLARGRKLPSFVVTFASERTFDTCAQMNDGQWGALDRMPRGDVLCS